MNDRLEILIIAHFTGDGPKGNNRFHDLARRLTQLGCRVEVLTSSFSHGSKLQRDAPAPDLPYKLTHVREPGYRRNVSIQRVLSHERFARQLRSYLQHRPRPDVVYCGVPSLSVGEVAAEFAQRHQAPLVVDVQDLWPEAFSMVVPAVVPRLAFAPSNSRANRVYAAADGLVAVSETYLERALRANPDCPRRSVVYLGTDLRRFDEAVARRGPTVVATAAFEVAYVGTLSWSYDLATVVEAVKMTEERTGIAMRLVVMGDGPDRERVRCRTQELGVSAEFTGRLPYTEMVSRLVQCDVAVNPIVAKSAASIINKVCDYAAAALPVLNMQDSVEYRSLIDKYGAGLNSANGDAVELAKNLGLLAANPQLRMQMARGSRKLAEDHFDRSVSYTRLAHFIVDAGLRSAAS